MWLTHGEENISAIRKLMHKENLSSQKLKKAESNHSLLYMNATYPIKYGLAAAAGAFYCEFTVFLDYFRILN